MKWLAMLLAAVVVAGCRTSVTEDDPPPGADTAKANPCPAKANPGTEKANPGPAGGSTSDGEGEEPLRLGSPEAAALLGADFEPPEAVLEADPAKRVDNSRCLDCHVDFSIEELSVVHAAYGVGCEKCHGPSDAHSNDEDNITPPSIMYPRDLVVKACMACHPAEDLADEEDHWDVFAPKSGQPDQVCTECHGEHSIATRDVHWNKRTGELIVRGGQKKEKADECEK